MKILMVNNQLSVLGGSETYMFSIGSELAKRGHDVQYFGKQDPNNEHTNEYGIYAKNSINPFSSKLNKHNVKQFAKLLDLFKPDVVHINLMYFILTPAIVEEAYKRNIPVIHTVHDPKIVCPNHRLYISQTEQPCMLCLKNGLNSCVKNKCVKNSRLLSKIATNETEYYRKNGLYKRISKYIFPSEFMKNIHIGYDVDEERSVVLHNFSRIKKIDKIDPNKFNDKYVLYFGRISTEKGMQTLLQTIRLTPNVKYKIAGEGPCKHLFQNIDNCENVGFVSGDKLVEIIKNATICVFPSIWYENCPMSILESIALGVPVIGSNIGGIPELFEEGKTGLVVEPSSVEELKLRIEQLYDDDKKLLEMSKQCISNCELKDVAAYVSDLEIIYESVRRVS